MSIFITLVRKITTPSVSGIWRHYRPIFDHCKSLNCFTIAFEIILFGSFEEAPF